MGGDGLSLFVWGERTYLIWFAPPGPVTLSVMSNSRMESRSIRERSRSVSGSRTAVEEDWESNVTRFGSEG